MHIATDQWNPFKLGSYEKNTYLTCFVISQSRGSRFCENWVCFIYNFVSFKFYGKEITHYTLRLKNYNCGKEKFNDINEYDENLIVRL